MKMDENIYVTRPELPPLDEFHSMLEQIWESRVLTNGGHFHSLFEQALAEWLGVPYISLTANGTLPLMLALRALDIEQGEVITTPYSFVATSHALQWSGLRPVFADISSDSFSIDPEQVERLITPRTRAILPVHVYGRPAHCAELADVARRHGLPLIYDAAHAFGVKENGRSLLEQGDMASLSFHATKVFNTIEGGALVCRSAEMKQRIDRLKNFGFASETEIVGIGINAKLDEVRSAYGLAALRHVGEAIERRREISTRYRALLNDIPGLSIPPEPEGVEGNYSHFPILVEKGYPLTRDALYERLRREHIYTRRYFYPLITHFEPYRTLLSEQRVSSLPNAESVARRILCLPLYPDLPQTAQHKIAALLRNPE